jgi:hypothetical protein
VGVGKSVDPVWDVQAQDARQSAGRVVPAWAAALCKLDAVRFAEQSCAAAVWPEAPVSEELWKLVQAAQLAAQPAARQLAGSILSARWWAELVAQRDVATQRLKGPQALASEHLASPPPERAESPAGPEASQ